MNLSRIRVPGICSRESPNLSAFGYGLSCREFLYRMPCQRTLYTTALCLYVSALLAPTTAVVTYVLRVVCRSDIPVVSESWQARFLSLDALWVACSACRSLACMARSASQTVLAVLHVELSFRLFRSQTPRQLFSLGRGHPRHSPAVRCIPCHRCATSSLPTYSIHTVYVVAVATRLASSPRVHQL